MSTYSGTARSSIECLIMCLQDAACRSSAVESSTGSSEGSSTVIVCHIYHHYVMENNMAAAGNWNLFDKFDIKITN